MLDKVSSLVGSEQRGNVRQDEAPLESLVQQNASLIRKWFAFLNQMGGEDTKSQYSDISMLEVLWRTILSDTVNGSISQEEHLRPSSQGFHDFLLIWMGYQRMLSSKGIAGFEDTFELDARHRRGPCWPSAAELLAFEREHSTEAEWQQTGTKPAGETLSELDTQFMQNHPALSSSLRIVSEALLGSHERRLFATKGGYLGYGMLSMQEGDQIWLLDGGKVPFVLRARSDGCYDFVGECYVHGVMSGEKWGTWSTRPRLTEVCLV